MALIIHLFRVRLSDAVAKGSMTSEYFHSHS